MSTMENLALAAGYVQQLLDAFDEKAAQAYVHGDFVNLVDGLVYYGFDRSENIVDLPTPPGAMLGAGMDFNPDPMSAAVFWFQGGLNPHIHFFDEIELPNSSTEDMCGELRDRYWQQGLRDLYPDSNMGRSTNAPAGRTDYTIMEDMGFEVNKLSQNPPRRDRWNTCNATLSPSGGVIRQTISPSCKKLIKCNSLYAHELINKQKALSHLLDARDYPVWQLFPSASDAHKKLVGA
jgi:hypothetical protein